jgi:hypothetical protein
MVQRYFGEFSVVDFGDYVSSESTRGEHIYLVNRCNLAWVFGASLRAGEIGGHSSNAFNLGAMIAPDVVGVVGRLLLGTKIDTTQVLTKNDKVGTGDNGLFNRGALGDTLGWNLAGPDIGPALQCHSEIKHRCFWSKSASHAPFRAADSTK